jgi:Mrp family chromosome partitioning ATPase
MALIVGLFLSISIVAVMEIFDHSLKTAEDVEIYTGQPVLGTIPEKKSIRRRWSRFDRYKGLIATASLDSSKPAVVKPGPEKPNGIYFQLKKLYQGTIASELQRISDSLRTIRQNDGLGKCIMVSGSIPKEGVTVICLNLVQTIGKVCSGRILLVDLDFQCRKSKEIRNLKGLGDIILGGCTPADAIYPSDISNIFILPSVQTDYDSYEVVGSDAFGKLLEQLRREFEVIIIDAPPMQHYSESVITAGLADGVILVVSAERTRREVVNNTCSLVTKARGKIIGIILNRRRHYIPRFLYRHI